MRRANHDRVNEQSCSIIVELKSIRDKVCRTARFFKLADRYNNNSANVSIIDLIYRNEPVNQQIAFVISVLF